MDFLAEINGIEITTTNAVFRLVVSMLLGACVGYERKRKGQPAGLRTFSLIAMGATLAMILSIYVPQAYFGLKNGDPGRIAAQVITGIGFLGAGAIIQMKGSVRGLTTAAGIWIVAAIGMAVGVGLYTISIVATVLIWVILFVLDRIEHRTGFGAESRIIRIRIGQIIPNIDKYNEIIRQYHMHMLHYYIEYDYDHSETQLNLVILSRETTDYLDICDKFSHLYPTKSISLANQLNI